MRAGTGTRLVVAAAMALAGLSLTACSDDPARPGTVPRTKPTTGSTTSPSPTPTPTSAEAEVEAAVRTYYAELTRAAQTNDTTKLKQLTDQNCPCYRAVNVIDKGASLGERSPDAAWQLSSVNVHDVAGKSAAAEVEFHVSAYDVVDSSGRPLAHIKAQRSHLDLSLVRVPRGWVVANVFDLEG